MTWPFVHRSAYDLLVAKVAVFTSDAVRTRANIEAARSEAEAHRLRAEALNEQLTFLREQNERLVDSLTRMNRVERGMGEIPREPRPPMEPAPVELLEYWDSFGDPRTSKRLRDEAFRAHAKGKHWSVILMETFPNEENGS